MTGPSSRRWGTAMVLVCALVAPNIPIGLASPSAASASAQVVLARTRGPGPAPARRAPRRSVRHGSRHDHSDHGRDRRDERREYRDDRRDERREYRDDRHDEYRRARRGRAITGAATRAVVGTRVRTLPRGCTTIVTNDIVYRECSGVYYRRYYEATTVVYVVVEAP